MNNIKVTNQTRNSSLIPVILMSGLIFLRFVIPIISWYEIIVIPNRSEIITVFSYLLTALLIIWVKDELGDFNIGLSTIVIFLTIPILEPIYNIWCLPSPRIPKLTFIWFQIITSILLFIILCFTRTSINKEGKRDVLKWLFISIVVGTIYGIITGIIYKAFITSTPVKATIPIFFSLFLTQVRNAALTEEPLFRGFLWGYLRKRNWKEHSILLFQAFIFFIGHFYYFPSTPIAFVGTFISGLVFGLVVWKSKNISTSIIVHGLYNSIVNLITFYVL